MVLVIRKDQVVIGEPQYRAIYENRTSNKTMRLGSGNDLSYGNASDEDTRELERNRRTAKNENNSDSDRNSIFSKMFNFLIGANNDKIVNKRNAKHDLAS